MLLVLLVVGMLLYIKEKAGDTGQTEATLVEQTEDQRHPLKQELQNLRLPGRGTAVVCVEAYVSNDCEQPGMMVFERRHHPVPSPGAEYGGFHQGCPTVRRGENGLHGRTCAEPPENHQTVSHSFGEKVPQNDDGCGYHRKGAGTLSEHGSK